MSLLNNPPAEKRILWQQGAPKAWNAEHIAKDDVTVRVGSTKNLGQSLFLSVNDVVLPLDSSQGYFGCLIKLAQGDKYRAHGGNYDSTLIEYPMARALS